MLKCKINAKTDHVVLAIIYTVILQDQPIIWTLNSETCKEQANCKFEAPDNISADTVKLKTIKRLMTRKSSARQV